MNSIGLMCKDGSLFCGDAAMNGFPSIHNITIWAEDLIDFRNSWDLMIYLNPNKIYASHGRPFPLEIIKKNINKIAKIKLLPLK